MAKTVVTTTFEYDDRGRLTKKVRTTEEHSPALPEYPHKINPWVLPAVDKVKYAPNTHYPYNPGGMITHRTG